MAKQKRIKIESTDSKGEKKVVYFKLPDSEDNKSAQLAYNKSFREALQSGAVLRQKLAHIMEEQGVWDATKEAEYNSILEDINEGEKALKRGGISLSEARDLALEMKQKRLEFRTLIAERSSMDGTTAEGQADNERFAHLVYVCLLDEKGQKVFDTKKDYEEGASEPYVLDAAGQLAEKLYGLDPNYENILPENKFLKSYKFSDDKLRLVNKDGHLIDIDEEGIERLIGEDGRFIAYDKDDEKYFCDRDGVRVEEAGDYEEKFTPFLDDSGKPIPVPKEETEEEVKEEIAAEEAPVKKGRPKKTQPKAKTE